MSSITARSNGTKRSDPGLSRSASSIAAAGWLASFRAPAMTRSPAPVSLRAMAMPSPRLPPVTITLRIATHHFACRSDGQGRNEGDRRRNLVPRKRFAAELQDLALDFCNPSVRWVGLCFQNDVGDDERTCDGVLSGPHKRHAYARVAIDHCFDLLRMDLEAANVDDPTPSADKMIAVTTQLDHVAGVDEAVSVCNRPALAAQIAGCDSR